MLHGICYSEWEEYPKDPGLVRTWAGSAVPVSPFPARDLFIAALMAVVSAPSIVMTVKMPIMMLLSPVNEYDRGCFPVSGNCQHHGDKGGRQERDDRLGKIKISRKNTGKGLQDHHTVLHG